MPYAQVVSRTEDSRRFLTIWLARRRGDTALLRAAITDRAVVITGDGAEFLRAVGFELQDSTISVLRAHPELLVNPWD